MLVANCIGALLSLSTLLVQIAADDCWKTTAAIAGGARQEHAVAAIDKDVYIVGGFKGADVTDTVEKYHILEDRWNTVAALPVAVHHANVAVVNGELYVLGSLKNTVDDGTIWPPLSMTYKYSPAQNRWSELGNMPQARGSSVVAVRDGVIYIAGGLIGMGKPVKTVSSFDTAAKTWRDLPSMYLSEARDHAGGAILGSSMYVVGGRVGNVLSLRDTTWKYDLSKDNGTWSRMPAMPTARGGAAVVRHGKDIYAFGGEGNKQATSQGVFSAVEAYDTMTDSWTVKAKMKTPRHGTGAVAVSGHIYIPGGGLEQSGGNATAYSDLYAPDKC